MIDMEESGTLKVSDIIGPLSRWAHDSKTETWKQGMFGEFEGGPMSDVQTNPRILLLGVFTCFRPFWWIETSTASFVLPSCWVLERPL